MTAPLTDELFAEILAHVPNCRYGCVACEAAPALLAEIRRLAPLLARAQARVEIAESARDGLEAERDDWRNRAEAALDEAGSLQAEILKALAAHDKLTRRATTAEGRLSAYADALNAIGELIEDSGESVDRAALDAIMRAIPQDPDAQPPQDAHPAGGE